MIIEENREYLMLFFLVHSTPGMNAISPYLNFDPKVLNPVGGNVFDGKDLFRISF